MSRAFALIRTFRSRQVFVLVAASGVVLPAAAHSPYLLPNTFDVSQRDHVSVQGSFTERFFVPDIVMKASTYSVMEPDGRERKLEPVYTRDLTVLDVETVVPGTYRISSGIREGRIARAVLQNEDWKFLDEREPGPTGVRVYDMRSITRAEAYVSRGTPTDTAVTARNRGLEFQFETHPNRLFAGAEARMKVLFDGRPLAGQRVSLQRAASDQTDAPAPVDMTSDDRGVVALPLPVAGLYHVMTRHRFVLPAGTAQAESHTYALTLEVTE